MPSGPNWMSPPLCPPWRYVRTISSLAGSIRGGSVFVTVKRDTRDPSVRFRWSRLGADQRVKDEALPILFKIRVEGQPAHRLDLLGAGELLDRFDFLAQVEEEVGFGVRLVGE